MQFNRIRISARAKVLLGMVRTRTNLTPNIPARFALMMSLKDPSIPNPDEFDEIGSELHPNVLFGEHEKMYMALMIKRLQKDSLDPELYLQKMLRAHINRGTAMLYPRIHSVSDFYDLVKEERK